MPPRTRRTAAVSPDVDAVDAVDLLAQELIDSSPSRQKSAAITAPGKTKPAIKKFSTKPKNSVPAPAEPTLPALAQALVSPNSSSPYADYPFKTALLLAQSDLDIAYNLGKKRQYKALLAGFDHTVFPRAVKPAKRKVRHYRVRAAKLSSQRALVIKQADARIKSIKKTKKGKMELANIDVDFDPSLFISSGTFRSSPSPPSLVSPALYFSPHAHPFHTHKRSHGAFISLLRLHTTSVASSARCRMAFAPLILASATSTFFTLCFTRMLSHLLRPLVPPSRARHRRGRSRAKAGDQIQREGQGSQARLRPDGRDLRL